MVWFLRSRMFLADTGGSLTTIVHIYHYRVRSLIAPSSLLAPTT